MFKRTGRNISLKAVSSEKINHKDEIIKADAVVVSPLNNLPWAGVILNLASRTAAAAANRNEHTKIIF